MTRSPRRGWRAPTVLASASLLFVSVAQADPPPVVVKVDRATRSDRTGGYFVVLSARREGLVGHAFVAWGTESRDERRSLRRAYGFYPAEDGRPARLLRIVTGIRGEVVDDTFEPKNANPSHRLIVRVDREVWLESQRLVERWKEGEEYRLLSRTCVTFTVEVARAIGLTPPKPRRTETPSRYFDRWFKELRRTNTRARVDDADETGDDPEPDEQDEDLEDEDEDDHDHEDWGDE